MGSYLLNKLKNLKSHTIKDVRGRGLFVGVEFYDNLSLDGNYFAKILMKNGILTKATHDHCIRFSPALVINKEEID
jgi:ornithine--oxo-acid transaminase